MSNTHRDSYKPTNTVEELSIIKEIYVERINSNASTGELEALEEYYRLVQQKELDAFEWLVEALYVVSKKDNSKRNVPYLAGMIRKWLVYGFGYIPTKEEEVLVGFIEQDFGVKMSYHSRTILQNLMATYGVIELTRAISKSDDLDVATFILQAIGERLEGK